MSLWSANRKEYRHKLELRRPCSSLTGRILVFPMLGLKLVLSPGSAMSTNRSRRYCLSLAGYRRIRAAGPRVGFWGGKVHPSANWRTPTLHGLRIVLILAVPAIARRATAGARARQAGLSPLQGSGHWSDAQPQGSRPGLRIVAPSGLNSPITSPNPRPLVLGLVLWWKEVRPSANWRTGSGVWHKCNKHRSRVCI